MLLSDEEFDSNVKDMKNSTDKRFFISILDHYKEELRDLLEDPENTEISTQLTRGGILQIRELRDLLSHDSE